MAAHSKAARALTAAGWAAGGATAGIAAVVAGTHQATGIDAAWIAYNTSLQRNWPHEHAQAVALSRLGDAEVVVAAAVAIAALLGIITLLSSKGVSSKTALRRTALRIVTPILAIGAAGTVTEHLLKPLLQRRIGVSEDSLGALAYPSGHATGGAAIAAVVICLLVTARRSPRRSIATAQNVAATVIGAAVLAWAACAGGSMALSGGHWFTDVLAGWATGAIVAAWLTRTMWKAAG